MTKYDIDRKNTKIIDALQYSFPISGFPAPRLLPTKFAVAEEIPSQTMNCNAIAFIIMVVAPCSFAPRMPDIKSIASKAHTSKISMSVDGIPYSKYSLNPLNESLLKKNQQPSLTSDFLNQMYPTIEKKVRLWFIEIERAIPISPISSTLTSTCKTPT